jgi:hypothetical protein
MEEWLVENAKDLKLPPVKSEETIFEYLVNEQGEWEHWYNRVSRTTAECAFIRVSNLTLNKKLSTNISEALIDLTKLCVLCI